MERENTQNRKRTRDHGGDEKNKESHKNKKPESVNVDYSFYNYDQKGYEFCDGIGVFDFPWLKEGVVFKADEHFEPEENQFAPCSSYLDDEGSFPGNLDQPSLQNLLSSPTEKDGNFNEKEVVDDSFSLLKVDDLEHIDCIWSCVIDEPLDIGLNKV